MAGAIAAALGAARLFLLTDVAGVLNKDKQLLTDLRPADIAVLQAANTSLGVTLPASLQDWKAQLGRRVPPYMIPSELIAVDALPTGTSNKVDRRQLEQRYAMARTLRRQEPAA